MLLLTQSQLFLITPFWNSCDLTVTHSAIYFEQTPDNVPFKLKETLGWLARGRSQAFCIVTSIPHENRGRQLFLVHIYILHLFRFWSLILIFTLWIFISHWGVIFVINIGHVYRNLFFFQSHLLTFWIVSEPKQFDVILTAPLSFQTTTAFSVLWLDFFLAWNGNFFHAIRSQSAYNRDHSESTGQSIEMSLKSYELNKITSRINW